MRKLLFLTTLFLGFALFMVFKNSVPVNSSEGLASMAFAHAVIPNLMNGEKQNIEKSMKFPSMDHEILEFRKYLKASAPTLPTITAMRANPKNNFHHAPIGLIEMSEVFGNIAEKLISHSKFTNDALRFYSTCAKNETLLSSVRAVCLRNLLDWSEKKGRHINPNIYSPHILTIADNLPKSQ